MKFLGLILFLLLLSPLEAVACVCSYSASNRDDALNGYYLVCSVEHRDCKSIGANFYCSSQQIGETPPGNSCGVTVQQHFAGVFLEPSEVASYRASPEDSRVSLPTNTNNSYTVSNNIVEPGVVRVEESYYKAETSVAEQRTVVERTLKVEPGGSICFVRLRTVVGNIMFCVPMQGTNINIK